MVRNIPEADNAAPLYQQAMNIVRALNSEGTPVYQASIHRDRLSFLMASYVKSLDSVMGIVERASAKPDCYFNRNWSQGDQLLLPEFAELKRFAKAAAYTARLASRKGDWKAALPLGRSGIPDCQTCRRTPAHCDVGEDRCGVNCLSRAR